jgi:hypothetical protein
MPIVAPVMPIIGLPMSMIFPVRPMFRTANANANTIIFWLEANRYRRIFRPFRLSHGKNRKKFRHFAFVAFADIFANWHKWQKPPV